jgi:membrane-associated phospholipid phosphatase
MRQRPSFSFPYQRSVSCLRECTTRGEEGRALSNTILMISILYRLNATTCTHLGSVANHTTIGWQLSGLSSLLSLLKAFPVDFAQQPPQDQSVKRLGSHIPSIEPPSPMLDTTLAMRCLHHWPPGANKPLPSRLRDTRDSFPSLHCLFVSRFLCSLLLRIHSLLPCQPFGCLGGIVGEDQI